MMLGTKRIEGDHCCHAQCSNVHQSTPHVVRFLLHHSVRNDRRGYLTPHMISHMLHLVLELHTALFDDDIRVEGMASELQVIHCEHGQLEVILSRTRGVSICVLSVTMIHGTNGGIMIVVKFNKVVIILELFNIYHADSAMIFNY